MIIFSIKLAQALVVILTGLLCIKANSILTIRGLYLLGSGFVLNSLYTAASAINILGKENFCYKESVEFLSSEKNVELLHIVSSFILFFSFINAADLSGQKKWWALSLNVLFCSSVIFLILVFEAAVPLPWMIFLYNSASLFVLAYFFYSLKDKVVYKAVLFISFGFILWGGLQFFVVVEAYYMDLSLTRALFSLLAKFIILAGFFEWCLDYSRESERKITKESEEKLQFAKTSKYFQNLIKVTFHEITIPINDLEENIRSISKYTVREAKPKFRELQSSFERVQTIVAVAKNSYIEGVSDKYDSFDYSQLEEEEEKIVSVNTLIEIAIKSIKGIFKGVNFIQIYGSRCYIECKQKEIVQVFINLFKNAVEAYDKESKSRDILVRSYVNKSSIPKQVIVEVESYGSNIPKEIIDKIWEQGFSTKQPDEANIVRGQGLFIIRQIMNRTTDASIFIESPIVQKDRTIVDGVRFKLQFESKALSSSIHLNNNN